MNFLRADPPDGSPINKVETITLYFDNRPTHVKITKASRYVSKAIVRGNTVEISITHPIGSPHVHFTVSWTGGKKKQLIYEFEPLPFLKVRTDPPSSKSIHDVETITLYLDKMPTDVEIWNASSKSIGAPIVKGKTVEVPITHPIKTPYVSFTVAWDTGRTHLNFKNETLIPPRFLRADPPDGSSINGVDTIILYFDKIPTDVSMLREKGIAEPIIKGKMVEIPITHPIEKPSTLLVFSWKDPSKREYRSSSLKYTNEILEEKE